MKRGRGKVEFEDLTVGTRPVATREHQARVQCTITLHRGEPVSELKDYWIDLKRRRSAVAGVRYGIEGMQVGGRRRIVVPPQLGFVSEHWRLKRIPANALLICEVELLELRPTHPIPPKLEQARRRKAAEKTP